jgi:peptide/nickel transport system permease protein
MFRYILRRSLLILLTMVLASIVMFAATTLLPGDVAQNILGRWATPEALENLREELGINRPAIVQYWDWATAFVRGDWGTSLSSRNTSVRDLVMARLGNSAMLAGLSIVIYVPLGIFLGVIAALKRDSLLDKLISSISMSLAGLPEFVTGLLLIFFISLGLKWLPANSSIDPGTGFIEAFPKLILPAITVSLVCLGYVARMTRATTVEVLQADYVRAAYLSGLSRTEVLIKFVLRNALLPTITVVAMSMGWLTGGLVVTESVFGYPGVGRLLVYSIQRSDLPLILACSMVMVLVNSVANLVADLLYGVLNPRIRLA